MCGEPDGAKKKNNAKKQFRRDGDGALQRRWYGRDEDRGTDKREHGTESHRYDQDGGYDGSKYAFHGVTPR